MNLTYTQLDALQELINIGVGQAANLLNEMIGSHIRLQVPSIQLLPPVQLTQALNQHLGEERVSSVQVQFMGSFSGTVLLIFPIDSAAQLIAVLTEAEEILPDLDAIKTGTLSEVGNIVINGVIGEISNLLHQSLRYSIPTYVEDQVDQLLPFADLMPDVTVLLAQTHFSSAQLDITGDLILVFKVGSLDTLLSALELS